MKLKKGDNVLCVENNSTVRPLVIESVGDKILFSKQLDKGVKRTFSLKEGSFQLIKPRYISEHEKKEYKNPYLEMNDRVKVIHVEGTDNTNLLGRDGIVISITENERGDREIMLYMEDTQHMANLELEYRMGPYLSSKLIQKSLVLKLDEPKAKQEDYIDGLLHIPEQTEEKKQKISPDLEVGDRIMAWDITGDRVLDSHLNVVVKEIPTTFMATVMKVLEYDQAQQNGIKYIVKIEDTDEVVGLYGGEWLGGSIHPIRDMYQKGTRDKWVKLPKISITEDIDIFGQGLLDPIEPEEFEGEDKEWDELVGNVEEPEAEPEYDYQGGQTDASVGFVAPSSDVTDNICKVKGFCEAQGPITFGQLKSLVEEATKKRVSGDIGRGVFKSLWRIIPFFVPQILLAAVGVTATRAINKIVTPALKDTKGYKSWWGKVVLKAMDIAEGDYIPDVALGDDPLSKIFFISDGLLEMIRDKYKLKFARYVAEYASTRPDSEPVPEWFVENLLRDYLNQKFLLNPPMEPKEGTEFQTIKEHDGGVNPDTGLEASGKLQTTDPFNRVEIKILNYLTKEFTREELNTISSVDETQVINDLEDKWLSTMKLFGEVTEDEESWIRSTRWAKWAVENYSEACDGPDDVPCDFKDVTTPIKSWPSWFEVDGDQSYWQKEYRKGTLGIGAYDSEEAEERAKESWWDYDVDMDHWDYGDTDDEELEIGDVRYLRTLNEHKSNQEEIVKGKVQNIVDSVYPHIVNNLGPSEYVNEPPTVELHKDIYERLSGVEGMRGEESESSEAQYERHTNTLYIYYPNMRNEKHVIQSLLHEYTHSLQNPEDSEGHRKDGYENDLMEKEASEAESNWKDYLIYLDNDLNEQKEQEQPGLSPELTYGDTILVVDVDREKEDGNTQYTTPSEGMRPETYTPYTVVDKESNGHKSQWRWRYTLVPEDKLEEYEESLDKGWGNYEGYEKLLYPWIYEWIFANTPKANKVDRLTLSENWRDTSWEDDDGKITIGDVTDYIGSDIRNISVSDLENKLGDNVSSVTQGEERIMKADLQYPIILVQKDGEFSYVLDGNHRLAKAIMTGEEYIKAKVLYLDDKNTPEEFKRLLGREEVINETITEHKETKVNPDLEKGDIIRVIDVDGEHKNMPERFKIYKVVNVSAYDKNNFIYDLVSPDLDLETVRTTDSRGVPIFHSKTLYRGDTWIYADIDRKTISEHTNNKLTNKFLTDFWPQYRNQVYSGLYNTYHPSAYVESFNRPSSNFEDVLEVVGDAVNEGKKLGLLDSSVGWLDMYDYNDDSISHLENTGEMPPNKVTDDNGLPTLRDQLEILDNTNLDWIHGILLFDVLEDIVDEFKSYCGENGVDESGMGKCMDEFPPSPDHEQINRTGGTLKQDYYTLYNFMKELERTGVNVKDHMKSPIFPNIIKLVDDGTTDYDTTGEYFPMRQDSEGMDVPERISEHKDTKLNPDLMMGDEIMVVSTEGIHDFGVPELYKPYVVVGIKHGTTMMKGGKELEDSQYYEVEPIGMTDEERLGHMLAGGGRRRPLYIFHRKDQWILRKGFRRGEDLNETKGTAAHYFQGQNNLTLTTPELEQDLKAFHGLEIDEEEELDEFCPMGNPNQCTPVDYDNLPDMLHENTGGSLNEHTTGRNMKGFTPKLIGYLKFMFESVDIQSLPQFEDSAKEYLDTSGGYSSVLYAILKYNQKEARKDSILHMLNVMPIGDYVIPKIWEYEVTHYGSEDSWNEQEDCDSDGFGEMTGEPCDCINAQKMVKDGEYYTSEDCEDHEEDDECECEEWDTKHYELFSNEICTKIILSYVKLERTLKGSDGAYGYEDLYDLESELGDDYVEESIECDVDYDETSTWQYFNDRAGRILGLDTDSWKPTDFDRMFTSINNNIYGVKPIEEQYDMVSTKDSKMKELTDQIFNILDENFGLFEHPEGEIEYDGKSMGLYSYENDNFVPFEHVYNPIMQMLEHGIQQEDIEVFVEIITNWVSKSMSTPEEKLNEEVNIKSKNSNYSQEEYDDFVDFAHKELKIKDDCTIDVEVEKSTEYTTGNYHIQDKKILVLDNGRKLADILRTIAHELVHHKQNELGMLVGDIPEIGGKIEDQANAYAGRLVKKYGKQTPTLYTESEQNLISEEKVVGFDNPNNNFVVIAGGPGAGKSFITKNLVNLNNVKEFNVDQVRVMTAKKLWGDEWEENISTEEGYDEILRRTFTTSDPRNLTVKFLKQFLQSERNQPVNVIYDAGGGQEEVMKNIHTMAKENGFNTTLVHVRTPLDIAQERNIERPRSLPPEMVAQYHQQVKNNMRNMIPIFDNVWTVDNKDMIDLSNRPSDNIEKIK